MQFSLEASAAALRAVTLRVGYLLEPRGSIHHCSNGLWSTLGELPRGLAASAALWNLRGSLEEPLERGNRWGPRRIGAGSRISVWLVSGVWLGFALPEEAGSPGALNELPKQIS